MKTLVYVFMWICLAPCLLAQQDDSLAVTEKTRHAVLPGAGFTNDEGFAVAVLYQFIRHKDDLHPYRYSGRIQGEWTSVGNIKFKSSYNWISNRFNRYRAKLKVENINSAFYFGTGNNSRFDQDLWDDGFYRYERLMISSELEMGIPITVRDNRVNSEWIIGTQFTYFENVAPVDNLVDVDRLSGYQGGWVNRLNAGLILDFRDNHFRPTHGFALDTRGGGAPAFAGNHSSFGFIDVTGSAYYPLIDDGRRLTAAMRGGYRQSIGPTRFYTLTTIGGSDDIRGYPLERFKDKGAVFFNFEFRSWLFDLPFWNIEAGSYVFMDGGRVFNDPFWWNPFGGYHVTAGIGGVVSVFRPEFIFRGDVGFSDETWRISIGTGFLF